MLIKKQTIIIHKTLNYLNKKWRNKCSFEIKSENKETKLYISLKSSLNEYLKNKQKSTLQVINF